MRLKKIFLVIIALTFSGCGYTTRSMLSSQYSTIYIAPFSNTIDITVEGDAGNKYQLYRPQIESQVTRAVSNKYLFDGSLKPEKEERASLTLRGELTQFRKDPLRYADNTENVTEYRVNIVVNISLYDNTVPEKKLLWQENGFTGETSYFVSGTGAISEDQAITNSINDLARRIVERTVDQW